MTPVEPIQNWFDTNILCLAVVLIITLQALHCENALNDTKLDTFKCFADDRIDPPDLNLLTLLYTSAKQALLRHSIRPTSAKVT